MALQFVSVLINHWVRSNLRDEGIEELKTEWAPGFQGLKPFKSNWTRAVKNCQIDITPVEMVDLLKELSTLDWKTLKCE